MTKEEALDLQATMNGILAQAAGERSRIGGPVNWADLRWSRYPCSMGT
jgi:hypothetical protein